MANAPQKESVAPQVPFIEQCPSCPSGNSLPLVAGEDACGVHVWWNAHYYSGE
jgi:hypothetical protein